LFEARRARKRIEQLAELTAATPDGTRARASGTVRLLERELHAPASGTPCVAFVVRVIEPRGHDPGRFEPNKPFDCVELVPFAIECTVGRVIVDSAFAELVLDEQPRVKRMHDVHWTDFVDARKLSPAAIGLERFVKAGDSITVGGTLARRTALPGAEMGFRESPSQLCLIGDFDHPLLVYQQP
jgi:hypothetical protein